VALRFADEASLEIALRTLVPPEVARGPVYVARDDRGLLVAPRDPLPAKVRELLLTHGVLEEAGAPSDERPCWAAAIAPRWVGEPDALPQVIFWTDAVVPLAAELLRLGCDRQRIALTASGALLEATEPPYYSVTRGLAFAPAAPRAFVQLGFAGFTGTASIWSTSYRSIAGTSGTKDQRPSACTNRREPSGTSARVTSGCAKPSCTNARGAAGAKASPRVTL
jgi:cellulose synthase operon protein C